MNDWAHDHMPQYVVVGRFTPTEVTPGMSDEPEQAFAFWSRQTAEEWMAGQCGVWYPGARVIELERP